MAEHDDDDPLPNASLPLDGRDVVDAGSEEGQRKTARELRRRKRREGEFFKAVLADPVGRDFLWNLLSEGGAFQTPFQCGPNGFPQPDATWFRAGQQSLVLGLYHRFMAADLDGVRLMLSEHDDRFKKVSK